MPAVTINTSAQTEAPPETPLAMDLSSFLSSLDCFASPLFLVASPPLVALFESDGMSRANTALSEFRAPT